MLPDGLGIELAARLVVLIAWAKGAGTLYPNSRIYS
jgi:hypothetical protein